MRRTLAAVVALAALGICGESAAVACLPPPPGWVPPTQEEIVRSAANNATDIVYGEIVRDGFSGRTPRFRVIHVYRGRLRPGQTIEARHGWGINPPMCAGMLGGPPPVPRGTRGTILFRAERPVLDFLGERDLELMLAGGFIQPRPAGTRRRRRD